METTYPVMQTEQISIEINDTEFGEAIKPAVDARDLYNFLESKQDYSTWIKRRIECYGFTENIDYIIIFPPSGGKIERGRPSIDYYVTIEMAKHLCMVENNDKGRKMRNYFLEVERLLNSDEYILRRALSIQEKQIKKLTGETEKLIIENKELKPKAEAYDKYLSSESLMTLNVAAKILGSGEHRLFNFLERVGVLYNAGGYKLPYQKYIDMGIFVVRPVAIDRGHGDEYVVQILVTAKGFNYLQKNINRLMEKYQRASKRYR